jgi:hypothetical protein
MGDAQKKDLVNVMADITAKLVKRSHILLSTLKIFTNRSSLVKTSKKIYKREKKKIELLSVILFINDRRKSIGKLLLDSANRR